MSIYQIFIIFTTLIYFVNFLLIIRAYMVHKVQDKVNDKTPFVSVLVPVYNEAVGVVDSIKSLLKQDYLVEGVRNYEIVIVDDGSTDDTSQILQENFGEHPFVMILSKENGGKASALNMAAEHATGEMFVCIDGDTILAENAISTMVGKLQPDADAMAVMLGIHNGMTPDQFLAKPTLPKGVVGKIQWLEYCKSYVIFRCSMMDKNAITVISGACGLIRREMFEKCGGYKEGQLGEDMELTMNIHSNGGKVQFLNETLAWTEAPQDVKSLGKQRVRWYRGALQSLIKHKNLLFRKKDKTLSWFLLPYIWASDVVGVWVEAISWVYLGWLLHNGITPEWYYFLFLVAYYFNTLMIMGFIKRNFTTSYKGIYKGLLLSTIEGIGYHFLFLYWSLKSHVLQLFGAKKKWNKLERRGVKN